MTHDDSDIDCFLAFLLITVLHVYRILNLTVSNSDCSMTRTFLLITVVTSMTRTFPTRSRLTVITIYKWLLFFWWSKLLSRWNIEHCHIAEIRTLPFLTLLSLLSYSYQRLITYNLSLTSSAFKPWQMPNIIYSVGYNFVLNTTSLCQIPCSFCMGLRLPANPFFVWNGVKLLGNCFGDNVRPWTGSISWEMSLDGYSKALNGVNILRHVVSAVLIINVTCINYKLKVKPWKLCYV